MSKIWAISLNTFRESVRSQVLLVVLFFALILVGITSLFGSVTIGDQIKVIKDFGLFSVSLFSVALVVISGSALLSKELSKKTIYNILAKSVSRSDFIIGKYFGMLITATSIVLLMGISLQIYLYFLEGYFDLNMVWAYAYNIIELGIICAAAILFSSIVITPILSGLFTFALFLAGRSVEYLVFFVEKGEVSGLASKILSTLNYILPNLDKLNIANDVVYNNKLAFGVERFIWSSMYGISYAGVLLLFSIVFFSRRDFN